jgi:hypothetical protein
MMIILFAHYLNLNLIIKAYFEINCIVIKFLIHVYSMIVVNWFNKWY